MPECGKFCNVQQIVSLQKEEIRQLRISLRIAIGIGLGSNLLWIIHFFT